MNQVQVADTLTTLNPQNENHNDISSPEMGISRKQLQNDLF